MPITRHIAHLDMDAFYASVELLRQPHLRGLPVVIGGSRRALGQPDQTSTLKNYVGRGVITTCTYEARALGIHAGMGLMKAAALCPEAILLPVDFDEYRRLSRLFKTAVIQLAPIMEDRGIDEVYLDLSAQLSSPQTSPDNKHGSLSTSLPNSARALAQSLKDAVFAATGLTCSIAIAPNKLLAKIGSDLEKPNGLTLLSMVDIPTRIWPLAAKKINGIGPKTAAKLARFNVNTIGDLAQCDTHWLIEQFGQTIGAWMHNAAQGHDERPVNTYSEPQSISRETTFERDLHPVHDRSTLTPILVTLCEKLSGDLERKGYVARTIGIKLRDENFITVTRDISLETHIQAATEILRAARRCLQRAPLEKRLRLLGVRASALEAQKPQGDDENKTLLD